MQRILYSETAYQVERRLHWKGLAMSVLPVRVGAGQKVVLRALRRDPGERYLTAQAMKADLDHPERVAMSSLCDRLRPVKRWRRRLRIVRCIVITFFLPVASQIALFLLLWHHFAHRPQRKVSGWAGARPSASADWTE